MSLPRKICTLKKETIKNLIVSFCLIKCEQARFYFSVIFFASFKYWQYHLLSGRQT